MSFAHFRGAIQTPVRPQLRSRTGRFFKLLRTSEIDSLIRFVLIETLKRRDKNIRFMLLFLHLNFHVMGML